MPRDPICGMEVNKTRAVKLTQNGLIYYFCSQNCKQKFLAHSPDLKSTTGNKTIYTCPMHPEIRRDKPGDCPKCGMHLEPVSPEAEDNEEYKLLQLLNTNYMLMLVIILYNVFYNYFLFLFSSHFLFLNSL